MAKADEEKDEVLVPVGDGVEEDESGDSDEGKDKSKAKAKESKEEESDDEESDESSDDERVGHEASDDEDEEEKKPTRRQRQRLARERANRELSFLRIRNQQLESRFGKLEERTVQNEAVAIEARIQAVNSQIKMADEVMAEALTQQKGKDHVEAQNIRDELLAQRQRLLNAKGQMSRGQQQQTVNPVIVANAQAWVAANNWYKPGAQDADSLRVKRIDDRLVQEGFDPATPDYWDELTNRVQVSLPHKFKQSTRRDDHDEDEEDDRPARKSGKAKGGPKFTTRGREQSLKSNEVHVSAARKAAMIEAGVWDDAKERQRYLKQYRAWDLANSSNA